MQNLSPRTTLLTTLLQKQTPLLSFPKSPIGCFKILILIIFSLSFLIILILIKLLYKNPYLLYSENTTQPLEPNPVFFVNPCVTVPSVIAVSSSLGNNQTIKRFDVEQSFHS